MAEQETQRKLSRREQRRLQGNTGAIGTGPSVPAEPTNRRERRAAASGKNRTEGTKDRSQTAVRGLDTSELVDDALARGTDKTAKWVKRNFNILQWIVVSAIAAWVGYQVFSWRSGTTHGRVSATLMKGVSASLAKLESADQDDKPAGIPADPAPTFKTNEERLKAAREGFEQTLAAHPSDGTAAFAQLGLASVDLDEGKYPDARALYEQVKANKVAATNTEIRGRALEGVALSYEGEGNTDAALKAYQELENTDIPGFKENAMLAEARLSYGQGDLNRARDLVTKLNERLSKEKDQQTALSFYLQPAVSALTQAIDPKAQAPQVGDTSSPEGLEKLQKALQELSKKAGHGTAPAGSDSPAPAPAEPAKAP